MYRCELSSYDVQVSKVHIAVGVNNPNPSKILLLDVSSMFACSQAGLFYMRTTATYTTIVIAYRRRPTLRLTGASHQIE
jgi:hypothetical protein